VLGIGSKHSPFCYNLMQQHDQKIFDVIYNRLRYISTLQNTCKIKACVGMEYIPSAKNSLKIKLVVYYYNMVDKSIIKEWE